MGTSTVTFSPRRTRIRSTCSMSPLMGSRCTALGRVSCDLPDRPSTWISTFGVFSASSSAWPGRVTCRVSVPWPYKTAGTRPARRTRRAAPLPNSVRGSATMRTSGTVGLLHQNPGLAGTFGSPARHPAAMPGDRLTRAGGSRRAQVRAARVYPTGPRRAVARDLALPRRDGLPAGLHGRRRPGAPARIGPGGQLTASSQGQGLGHARVINWPSCGVTSPILRLVRGGADYTAPLPKLAIHADPGMKVEAVDLDARL
jgi:hypothetical protein